MALEPGEVCQYAAAHLIAQVPAVCEIDCGRVGIIPACERCAAFYERMGGKRV